VRPGSRQPKAAPDRAWSPAWSEEEIGLAAALACQTEVEASKPGNVTPRYAFPEMKYEDFLASAAAIRPVLADARRRRVGHIILSAVEATRRVIAANTNLGTVLLLAPLARAAALGTRSVPATDPSFESLDGTPHLLRDSVRSVLRDLDVRDAAQAYEAIRLASPGAMGRVPSHDLSSTPQVSLLEAMRSAQDHDAVAREYATDFEITFESGLPTLERGVAEGLELLDATVELFLELLSRTPDTLIQRKFGRAAAEEAARAASVTLASGPSGSTARARAVAELDGWLRSVERRWNPGTTADLVAATLFVWLLATSSGQARLRSASMEETRDVPSLTERRP
jgi:triphosphoribosyl-dephospho-CoA synthase